MQRAYDLEILDQPVHDQAELERSLEQVAAVNRYLGGDWALRRALAPLLADSEETRLLDVGAGNGEVAVSLSRWAAGHGRRWRITALDLHTQSVKLAARKIGRAPDSVRVVQGDGLALPFPDRAFDVAYTVLTLHHFREEAAVALLREMARVVRRLVVVNDLERSEAALFGARALAMTVWRGNRITRNDGPLSVRRAFTPDELMALAERAGLRRPRVRRRLAFRLVLEAEP